MMRLTFPPLLTEEELHTVAHTIAEVEAKTSGEIRVSIRRRRGWRERKLSIAGLALREFHHLGMNKTKDKTGVLLFICVADRAFHIVGDEGIHKKVPDTFWESLADTMGGHFKDGKFCHGICSMIKEIGAVLEKEFPSHGKNPDELPNDVVVS
ncbi:MAG: TPM domain-containing protein [Bacteroidota bacterium]|nr:TPM domain-containing protein [Bacteroidota bacterium]